MWHWVRFSVLSVVSVLVIPIPVNGQATGLVSFRKPDGLALSTGNLYFTSHAASTASVWRAGQSSIPGQETLLYSEPNAIFGDIVFAQVDGTFFGYFFAIKTGVTTIRRVPLTGGATKVLTTGVNVDVANTHRNLVTDGVNLYWQEDRSVRKMPIRGGAVTVLDPTNPDTPTAGIALQNGNVIYATGLFIRFVPTSGATTPPSVRTIAVASNRVSALHAVSNAVYWGEQGGTVKKKVGAGTTTLPSVPGLMPTSISSNGTTSTATQAWTQCSSQSCRLQVIFPTALKVIGADALGVTVTPSGNVFWGDAGGIHRQKF